MSSINLRAPVRFAAIAFAALLAFGIWFSIKRTNGFVSGVPLETPLQVEVNPVNSQSPQSVSVSGRTTMPAKVSLDVGALPYYSWQDTNPDGSFQFDNVIVPLGATNLKVNAKASVGWKRFEGNKEANVWLSETDVPTKPNAAIYQTIIVESTKLPKVIDRKVT